MVELRKQRIKSGPVLVEAMCLFCIYSLPPLSVQKVAGCAIPPNLTYKVDLAKRLGSLHFQKQS